MAVNHSITQFGTHEDFNLQLARGQILNHNHIFKYGYNGAVGATAETIWFQGGVYTWQSAAAVVKVSSSSTADDADTGGGTPGTGALTVTLEGLDANYAEISETVTMNGTTTVDTTNSFLRLHRMYVATAGTGLTNAGVVYAAVTGDTYGTPGVPDTATKIMSTIGASEGQTLQAFYTIPAGYTGYVPNITASSADGTNTSVVTFRARESGGAFRTKNKFVTFEGTYPLNFPVPQVFSEKTDLEIIATGNASPTDVAATFDLILVKN
jgi:hypothetical protein